MAIRSRRRALAGRVSCLAACVAGFAVTSASPAQDAQSTTAPAATFQNPLKRDGADPWMTYFDGNYYLSTTTAVDIRIRKAPTLAALRDAADVRVWHDTDDTRRHNIWASEFHRLDAGDGRGMRWYGYYTANDNRDDANHRMYVIESAGDDPLGPYTFKAKLRTDPDDRHYAIDGHVLRNDADGKLYFFWCGRPSEAGQGLYVSRMTNPWTLDGPRVYLNASGFGERVPVREGPQTLQRDGKIYLIYSASPADLPDYKLGLLIADAKADLLDPKSWRQHPEPVFTRNDAAGIYGPGHNYFFTSPDGTEDWIVYHAKTTAGQTYRDRTTRAQPFTWNADGTPNFGRPLATGVPLREPSGTPPTTRPR